jgi:Ribbon-helix-helix protein, copG family
VTDTNVTGRRPRQTAPTQRLNVNISTSAMSTLAELAATNGISMTEAVRRAIQLLKLVDDATHEGRQVQLVDPDTKQVQTLRFL